MKFIAVFSLLSLAGLSQTNMSFFNNDILNSIGSDETLFKKIDLTNEELRDGFYSVEAITFSVLEIVAAPYFFGQANESSIFAEKQIKRYRPLGSLLVADGILRPVFLLFNNDPRKFARYTLVKTGAKGICRLHDNYFIDKINPFSRVVLGTVDVVAGTAHQWKGPKKAEHPSVDVDRGKVKKLKIGVIAYVYGGYLIYRDFENNKRYKQEFSGIQAS